MRKRIFDIIQIGNKGDAPSRFFDYAITIIIFLNLIVTFTITFPISTQLMNVMNVIELVTMIIFTVEYFIRLWTADYLYPDRNRGKAILAFILSFYGLIDLLTILPYWLPIDTIYGLGAFRIIRVFRIFHLFRVNSQSDAYNVIVSVINEKKGQLLSSMSLILILMLSASFIMYSVEHNAQPDVFDNAFSGLWWAVSTVLTVGYGDIYPITVLGKSMAIVISILGVMITAIPTGILSAGFSENYREMRLAESSTWSTFNLHVCENNTWIGMKATDIYEANGIMVTSVIRGNTQLPVSDVVVKEGDVLICACC